MILFDVSFHVTNKTKWTWAMRTRKWFISSMSQDMSLNGNFLSHGFIANWTSKLFWTKSYWNILKEEWRQVWRMLHRIQIKLLMLTIKNSGEAMLFYSRNVESNMMHSFNMRFHTKAITGWVRTIWSWKRLLPSMSQDMSLHGNFLFHSLRANGASKRVWTQSNWNVVVLKRGKWRGFWRNVPLFCYQVSKNHSLVQMLEDFRKF